MTLTFDLLTSFSCTASGCHGLQLYQLWCSHTDRQTDRHTHNITDTADHNNHASSDGIINEDDDIPPSSVELRSCRDSRPAAADPRDAAAA